MYGAGKIACEQMLRAYYTTSGLPYTAFRYFNVYGPRMDIVGVYTEVLIRWLDAIEANQAPLIFGDGTQSLDFVYVGDVARANLLAAQSDVTDEVFNVGTGLQTSLNELCDLVLDLTGSSLRPEHREVRKVANVQLRRAAVEKAAKLLDFQAKVSLREGLQELIRWRGSVKAAPVEVEA
jgi:UDP-glucose 4-epimerase